MKIVAKNLEPEALSQFHACMNDPSAIDGALMADAHTGYTLPIGGVILSKGKVFPSYVGFDIGCGMCAVLTDLERKDVEPRKKEIFDKIYEEVPCGEGKSGKRANVHPDTLGEHTDFAQSIWESNSNQLGTLGGGNHFIEIGYDETDRVWVIVHSGSRGLGYKIGDHYMRLAKRSDIDTSEFEKEFDRTHADLKKHNPEKYWEILGNAIEKHIRGQMSGEAGGNHGFDVLSPEGKDYLKDMMFALRFALKNREIMMEKTLSILGAKTLKFINKNHNCADVRDDGTILHRKGATSSFEWEEGVIPGNMRDGSVIVEGKGNPEFLCCSSHGAGRVMSRQKSKTNVTMKEFQESMIGITAKVDESTKDESPFVYKNFEEVLALQEETIRVLHRIKPIINIKG